MVKKLARDKTRPSMTVTSRAEMEWQLLLCGSPAGSFLRKNWVRLHRKRVTGMTYPNVKFSVAPTMCITWCQVLWRLQRRRNDSVCPWTLRDLLIGPCSFLLQTICTCCLYICKYALHASHILSSSSRFCSMVTTSGKHSLITIPTRLGQIPLLCLYATMPSIYYSCSFPLIFW